MKIKELVDARFSLQKLIEQDLPLTSAYDLYLLVQSANQHLDLYGQEIQKPDCNVEDLDNMEIDIPAKRIRIPISDHLVLSALDIKNLEPFAVFEVMK